jgi:hypothetical protein
MLPAYELGANAGEFAFAPLGMKQKQGLRDHEAEDGVTEEFEALIVAGGVIAAGGLLMGEGAVREGAGQQFGTKKRIPE